MYCNVCMYVCMSNRVEITGTSNLATEQYVNTAIINGGGGTGTTDLTNYYSKTETDTLLNNRRKFRSQTSDNMDR